MQVAQVACVLVGVGLAAGCIRYDPQPLVPAQAVDAFGRRSLDDPGLKAFLETNGVVTVWPRDQWDCEALVLAAFYYHPDMDVARARWHTATASVLTASQRPNPTLAFTPRFNSSSLGTGITPWILGGVLDIPIETQGKRRHRVTQARHLGEKARFELAGAAWKVRSRVRTSLIELQAARETVVLLRERADTLERVSRLTTLQWEAGAVSPVEASAARTAHQNAMLRLEEVRRQETLARGRVAEAIGLPLASLDGVEFVFSDLASFPADPAVAVLQRQAVLNRADILGVLAEYAASESALQVQVARQYPDLRLRPGYELDQTKNKWQLGLTVDLPVLNQNRGPIAEARAKREEVAARFNAVQAQAIGELERASAGYAVALEQVAAADRLVAGLEERKAAMTRSHEAGEVDLLAILVVRTECCDGALARLEARLGAQQSLAALENAVQSPVLMPLEPAHVETGTLSP